MSVTVIAEIGANHEGNLDEARVLIERAKEAGADIAKFQSYRAETLVSNLAPDRVAHFRRLSLSREAAEGLAGHARRVGIRFLSTPFDLESVAYLDELQDCFKIASGDLTFTPLLRAVAARDKRIYLSTGLAGVGEIEAAVATVRKGNPGLVARGDLVLMHCVTAYPTPPDQANLRAIPHLARHLGLPVGYSDHVKGIHAALAAVALGAVAVEKHFTLDKTRTTFRDHALSADPTDLAALVRGVREIESMLGADGKPVGPLEESNRTPFRRSVCAARPRRRGERLDAGDLLCLRPLGGIPAERWDDVVGRTLARDVAAGQVLQPADLEGGLS